MKKQKYPPGWNEKRVRKVIAHYENQTEEGQAAEIERALKAENITLVAVPTPLVPKVLTLIKRGRRTA
jgi:predicted dinucleotide-binding enzyme